MKTVKDNPNAAMAGLSGAITAIVVWVADAAGLEMDAATASAFTVVIIAAVLYVGKFW